MKPRDKNPKPVGRATKLWRRHGGMILGALALVVVAAVVWHLLADTASTKREVAATPMLMLPPPPPPPPPEPEKLPEPQPDKIKPEVADIKPSAVDKPQDDAPSPSKDSSDPVTINGDAQAGSDAFGVRAGSGGGSTGGGGLGGSSYSRYVSSVLQQALARDPRTRQLVFDDIRIDVWLAADGKTARAQLVQGTGNATTDEAVLAMVRDLDRIDERPPASMRFPDARLDEGTAAMKKTLPVLPFLLRESTRQRFGVDVVHDTPVEARPGALGGTLPVGPGALNDAVPAPVVAASEARRHEA